MKHAMSPSPSRARLCIAALVLASGLGTVLPAAAALIDLSQSPLASSSSGIVKPNISFVLDSSGSMAWSHAPDESQPFASKVGYKTTQCNSIYYRPDIQYVPPKHSDGTDYPNSSFTGAWKNGFTTGAGTVDLSSSFYAYDNTSSFGAGTDTAQPAYYYLYLGSQTPSGVNYQNTSSQFYKECNLNESPKPYATITFSGSNSTAVVSITVNGLNIMSGSTSATTSSSTLASSTAALITVAGYSATASGSTVTINGPASAAGVVPVVTTSPPQPTATVTFSAGGNNSIVQGIKVGGTQIMIGATSATTSTTTMATNVAGNISLAGYSATSSGSTVTITGPAGSAGLVPVVTIQPVTATATITVSGSGSTSVSSIKVNGLETMSGTSTASSSSNTVASNVAAKINQNGFSASASGSTITISGPLSAAGFTPVVTKSGGKTLTPSAFVAGSTMNYSASSFTLSAPISAAVQAFTPFQKVIVSATSGPGGTDERQNFANWFSYYRWRILMMKSGAGRAFASIGSNYRVGFMTIYATPSSSTTDPNYLAINDFDQTQKDAWYSKFYGETAGGSTPLKTAFSTAGRNIAGKLGPDPIQYSCQQNFLILTTDGYWNAGTANAVKLDGSTAVGNQDNNATATPRPMYDGGLSGASNTLADASAYYYNTDLRTTNCNSGVGGADVCQNNVPVSGADSAPWQHMTTFTLGLGTNGLLGFSSDYLSGGSADYNAIVSGSKNWPVPTGDTLTTIDDLWHAAVDGHGEYFSAKNPDLLVSGLRQALAGVSAREAAGAAAATSNLEPVAGDNFAFVASYTTVKWDGEIQARPIDLVTGAISSTPIWSGQAQLDTQVSLNSDSRTIFTFLGGAQVSFAPSSFTTGQKSTWFDPTASPALSQFAGWTPTQVAAATPDTLINYLRGQFGYEERGSNAVQLYRERDHVLGDIIDGKPVYVKSPPFNYSENSYQTFKTSLASRQGVVYVAANDGMLHAFDSLSGNELWAYVPSFVIPNLKALADDNYANAHEYYVDGSPTVSDVWTGTAWRTILVGGLNGGGKGYYALDITDPAAPTVIWEYSDTNLGFSYGNPVIGKLTDGTWIVAFTSGYNNTPPANPSADGVGRLYVLNAYTGTLKFTVSTNVGTSTSPSGLGRIAAWVNDGLNDNTIQRIYGGDMLGNLWRFDIDNIIPPAGIEATQLAFFQVGTYQQPITTAPELGIVNNKPVIYVATGRYLGTSDLTDTNQQSLYAIVDQLNATGLGNARTETTCPLVQQSLTIIDSNTRSTSTLPVDLASKCGWFLDFNPSNDSPGERVNVDPKLQLGVLAVATNVPEKSVCTVGGTSWLYFFDYSTGQFVSTSSGNVAGQKIGNSIAVGLNTYRLPDGRVVSTITTSDDQHPVFGNPSYPGGTNVGKRVQWRELLN
ncbi:MAG TPA: PilC/PilY family type IV pilus protein [Usitatibacter sp.]|nr:PilC/PilY family type IV pilus protein [Usitatibacter sp.]